MEQIQVQSADEIARQIAELKEAAKLARRNERKAATRLKHDWEAAIKEDERRTAKAQKEASKAQAEAMLAEAKAQAIAEATAMLAAKGLTIKDLRSAVRTSQGVVAAD